MPAPLQDIAVSCEGWRILRKRYGGNFRRILREVLSRDGWGDQQTSEFQLTRLRSFVSDTATKSPFYIRRLREADIDPEDIRSPEDFAQIPILDKKDVQRNWEDIHSPDFDRRKLRQLWTSGTTGTGLRIDMTLDSWREMWAVWWRYRFRLGLAMDRWCGLVTGHLIVPVRQKKPPFWRINVPGKAVLYSNYHISEKNIPHYIRDIARRKLTWLHGYSSALNLLARWMVENDERLPHVCHVTTGGESLLEPQREVIEAAFGLKVFDHYGLGEAVANASQCPAGNYHVDEDFAYTEFLPHESIDGLYRIVGTNLSNPAFPLLRFDTADLVRLDDSGCDCGLPGRIVKDIVGRDEDYVLTPDGNRFTQPGWLFYGLLSIREGQVVQKELDLIEVRLVRGRDFSDDDLRTVERRIRDLMGDKMRYRFRFVDAVERTAAGKIKCLISEIEERPIGMPEKRPSAVALSANRQT